jgi:hypothetical protein
VKTVKMQIKFDENCLHHSIVRWLTDKFCETGSLADAPISGISPIFTEYKIDDTFICISNAKKIHF